MLFFLLGNDECFSFWKITPTSTEMRKYNSHTLPLFHQYADASLGVKSRPAAVTLLCFLDASN